MELNRQPIARDGEPALERDGGRGGQDLSIWTVQLSDAPSREWRARFNDLAATDRAVSGYGARLKGETVRFAATADILAIRLARIDGWIKRANEEVGF